MKWESGCQGRYTLPMVRLIVWIVVGLLALSFFGISLEALYNSQTNQENISFLSKLFMEGWNVIADQLNGFFAWLKDLFGYGDA